LGKQKTQRLGKLRGSVRPERLTSIQTDFRSYIISVWSKNLPQGSFGLQIQVSKFESDVEKARFSKEKRLVITKVQTFGSEHQM